MVYVYYHLNVMIASYRENYRSFFDNPASNLQY